MLTTQATNPFAFAQSRPAQAAGHHVQPASAKSSEYEKQAQAPQQPGPAQSAIYGQPTGSAQAATLFFAQQAAQSSEKTESSAGSSSSAEEVFLDYMQKSLAERMREAILKDMGLTEEQLASLPAEQRERIEQQIRDEILERMTVQAAERAKAASS